MALLDFVQDKQITAWVQEQIHVSSQARGIFQTKMADGQSVLFPVASSGSAKAYTSGMDLVNTNVTSSNVTIALDQYVYDMQNIDNVDNEKAAQGIAPQVSASMGDVFARWVDLKAYTAVHTDAIAGGISSATLFGTVAAPITVDDATKFNTLMLNIRKALVKKDIPLEKTFVVIPPELGTLATQLSAASYRDGQNSDAFANGFITKAFGVSVYESNNLPLLAAGKRGIIFGDKDAACIAIGFEKVQSGSSMPVKFGEYIATVMNAGFGANNKALVGAGCIVEA